MFMKMEEQYNDWNNCIHIIIKYSIPHYQSFMASIRGIANIPVHNFIKIYANFVGKVQYSSYIYI